MQMRQIVRMRFGSHLYGTATPASDTDIKGVFIPDARDILLQRGRAVISTKTKADGLARNTADDVDTELFALHRYLGLVAEGQTVALDMLFAPVEMVEFMTAEWGLVRLNAHRLICRRAQAFVGYCRQQSNKYGIKGSRVAEARKALECLLVAEASVGHLMKLADAQAELERMVAGAEHMAIVEIEAPKGSGRMVKHLDVCNRKMPFTSSIKNAREIAERIVAEYGQRALQAERNEGVDWKALSHAVRVGRQAIELLRDGCFTFPRPEAAHLLAIKTGQIPYVAVAEEIEHLLVDVEEAAARSTLPEQADQEWIDYFVASQYEAAIRGRYF